MTTHFDHYCTIYIRKRIDQICLVLRTRVCLCYVYRYGKPPVLDKYEATNFFRRALDALFASNAYALMVRE